EVTFDGAAPRRPNAAIALAMGPSPPLARDPATNNGQANWPALATSLSSQPRLAHKTKNNRCSSDSSGRNKNRTHTPGRKGTAHGRRGVMENSKLSRRRTPAGAPSVPLATRD